MISIVCVYNNKDIFNSWLLKSLASHTVEFELIRIDNTKDAFKSMAQALNYGGKKAKGKYIMFVHQDMDLGSNSWLEEIEKILDKLPNLGIAGVAGKGKNKKDIITNIKHGASSVLAGTKIKNSTKVQTLDECLVIVPKLVFDMFQFDKKVCDDWHLYAVDYCLSIKKMGFDVYVVPMFAYHRSSGYSMSERYYSTLKKVIKKHKRNYECIYTTTGNWNTSCPLTLQMIYQVGKLLIRIIKNKVRKWIEMMLELCHIQKYNRYKVIKTDSLNIKCLLRALAFSFFS